MSDFVWVCLGAAIGAPARYVVDRAISARHDTVVPWGTLAVNLAGSLVLGLLTGVVAGHVVPREVSLLLGAGLCGGLTTYSTFGYETWRLVEDGARLVASANVAANMVGALAAALLGHAIGAAI